jgi:hypothetical protein
VGNTESMKQKRPELLGVMQVKQGSHGDANRVPWERCVRAQKKIRIKSLETVGVVRDNAVTGEVKSGQKHMYGNATRSWGRGPTINSKWPTVL